MSKKSILFIHPFLPYPLESGGHQALYNGIAAIKDDYNIFLLYEVLNKEDINAKNEFQKRFPDVILIPHIRKQPTRKEIFIRKINTLLNKLLLGEKQPWKRTKEYGYRQWMEKFAPEDPTFCQTIYQTCLKCNIDIAQVEMPWYMDMLYCIPDNVKKVYVHHELAFARHELEMKDDKDYIFAKVLYEETKNLECSTLNSADAIITLSEVDKTKLTNLGVIKPIYSSFAVVEAKDTPILTPVKSKRLTFVGLDGHTPNYIGVKWFLENCWNKLKQHDNDYSLDIVGIWSPKNVEKLSTAYSDIHFLGFVPNLESVLRDSIMIVPITIGSGIRMKILEACNIGIPFVSTTVGAEGIPLKNGIDCFVTDNPEEFVQDILKLQNPDLCLKFVKNSHKMVMENYSLNALHDNRKKIYNSLL